MNERYSRSQLLWSQSRRLLLEGVNTLSKSPVHIAPEACPIFIEKARGAYFWDVDGNRFLDFPMALGAVVLGHAFPEVDGAIADQLQKGVLYSLSSPLELELAERLCEIIPCAQKVRFLKSGSEAVSAAVRVARAYTGRQKVAVCGYHGWHDWTAVRTARKAGVPAAIFGTAMEFAYNDLQSLRTIFDAHPGEIAAVVMEPVGMHPPHAGFLEGVAALTRDHGALLVFDEVITGFRLSLGGAQSYFSVTPDLATFGKALGNGMPISVLAGTTEIMDAVEGKVFISTTFGGELCSIAAALVTLEVLSRPESIPQLHHLGRTLRDGLTSLARERRVAAECLGLPHKTFLVFQDDQGVGAKTIETLFRQECLRRGVFLGYGHFVSLSHSAGDIQMALSVADEVFSHIGQWLSAGIAADKLDGGVAQDVFKRY